MDELDNELWRFALTFYGVDGVPSACLTLQASYDFDVVHFIAALYEYRTTGHLPSRARLAATRERLYQWRLATVLPLRRIRQDLKPSWEDCSDALKEILRETVKRAELLAEQIQIALLWETLERPRKDSPAVIQKGGLRTLLAEMISLYSPEESKGEKALEDIKRSMDVFFAANAQIP